MEALARRWYIHYCGKLLGRFFAFSRVSLLLPPFPIISRRFVSEIPPNWMARYFQGAAIWQSTQCEFVAEFSNHKRCLIQSLGLPHHDLKAELHNIHFWPCLYSHQRLLPC